MTTRTTRWLLAAIVLLGVGCEARESPPPTAAPSPPRVHAATSEVERVSLPARIEVTGVTVAKVRATLAPKIGGLVRRVSVREGDLVRRGDPVVRLDDKEVTAHVARAKAELDNARIQWNRMRRLYDEDSVAKQELDDAERTFRVAKARYRAALIQRDYTVIRSPFDGQVTDRLIEPGEFAAPGQPVIKVERPDTLQLVIHVPEQSVAALTRGTVLPVIIDALDRPEDHAPLSGSIAEIVPASDPASHTVLVKVDLPRTPGLHSGMFGRAFLTEEPRSTLVVPATSLVRRHELTGVYVVGPDETVQLRWVKTGKRWKDAIEILSGLTEGERILEDATQGVDGGRLARSESRPPPGKAGE